MVGIQSLFVHLEDAADQRKAVAVNAAGCDSDKGIACFDVCSGDEILLIYHANCEAGQIVLIFRIKARHLAVSPPIRAASDWIQPSATPFTMEAIFSG